VAWYARELPLLRWAALGLNLLLLLATPVHGGHFVIDIAAGIVLALATVALVSRIAAGRPARSRSGRLVIEAPCAPPHEPAPQPTN